MPYSSGVTLNGEAVELVDNNLVYTALIDIEVVITGSAGNSYITSITVATPVSSLSYVYSEVANGAANGTKVESTAEIEFTNCVAHNGQYIALKENNSVKIFLAKGSKLTVNMPYSSGVTLNGEAVELVDNNLVYTALTDIEVVIIGSAGNSYITSITVVTE